MRILKSGLILLLLATLPVFGQGKYRVGLCPGSVQAYQTLARKVSKLAVPDKGKNDDSLKKYLGEWASGEKLARYQVAIHYPPPTARVRFWKKTQVEKGTFFEESVSSAAGRGNLSTATQPGDNQRCFFQDTTVVLDTLHIRLGDFSPDTHFTLLVNQQKYPLPLNADRTELLLFAGLLPNSPTGRHLSATMQIETETRPVTLYFLSPDDRAQLVRSLRDWVADEPPGCTDLMELMLSHLTWNWGGKHCVSPALYNSAQRQVVRNLLRTEQISCTP